MVTPVIGTCETVGTTQVAETVLKLSPEPAVMTPPDQLADSMFVGVAPMELMLASTTGASKDPTAGFARLAKTVGAGVAEASATKVPAIAESGPANWFVSLTLRGVAEISVDRLSTF